MEIKIQEKLKSIVPTKRQRLLIGANTLAFAGAVVLMGADFWALCVWSKWHSVNIQTPVVLQSPITITTLNAETSGLLEPIAHAEEIAKTLTDEDKITVANDAGLGWVVTKVGMLESGNGKYGTGHHKFCEGIGKSNEFGYFKGGNRSFCFNSFEDSVEEVTGWFQDQLQSRTLDQALCLYNTGTVVANCTYAQNFHSL